jgi:hypothetical protein
MELTREEWAARANKYGYGINAMGATKDELVEFVQTTMYLYDDITDTDLWCCFLEQFEGFTVESFKKIPSDSRSKLRKFLLKRGVYVGKNNNRVPIYKLLYEVLQRDEEHKWTDEDIVQIIKELKGPLLSCVLRKRLNPTRDGLANSAPIPSAPTTPIPARTKTQQPSLQQTAPLQHKPQQPGPQQPAPLQNIPRRPDLQQSAPQHPAPTPQPLKPTKSTEIKAESDAVHQPKTSLDLSFAAQTDIELETELRLDTDRIAPPPPLRKPGRGRSCTRLFNSRVVDEIKNLGTDSASEKSRPTMSFCACGIG